MIPVLRSLVSATMFPPRTAQNARPPDRRMSAGTHQTAGTAANSCYPKDLYSRSGQPPDAKHPAAARACRAPPDARRHRAAAPTRAEPPGRAAGRPVSWPVDAAAPCETRTRPSLGHRDGREAGQQPFQRDQRGPAPAGTAADPDVLASQRRQRRRATTASSMPEFAAARSAAAPPGRRPSRQRSPRSWASDADVEAGRAGQQSTSRRSSRRTPSQRPARETVTGTARQRRPARPGAPARRPAGRRPSWPSTPAASAGTSPRSVASAVVDARRAIGCRVAPARSRCR